jgi:hypothetical protein
MNFQILNNQNPFPDIRFDFLTLHATAGVYWTPNSAKRINVSAEYDRAWVNSDILYLNLPFLTHRRPRIPRTRTRERRL